MPERPHIVIKTEGLRTRVLIDGNEIPGVTGFEFSQDFRSGDPFPMLKLHLKATDVTLDTAHCPALPYPFNQFYELKESIREPEECRGSDMESINVFIDSEELTRAICDKLQVPASFSNRKT